MPSLLSLRPLLLLSLGLGLGACSTLDSVGGVGDWFANAEEVEVEEYARSTLCGTDGDALQISVFPDLARFEDWREQREVSLGGLEHAREGRIAVIEAGQRPTAGYQIAVSRVAKRRGRELTVNVTLLSPRPGAIAAQMITSPCVVIGLPDFDVRKLRVVDQSGQVRGTWHR